MYIARKLKWLSGRGENHAKKGGNAYWPIFLSKWVEYIAGRKRNCSLQAFSSFPWMFFRVANNHDLVQKDSTFSKQVIVFTCLQYTICGKRRSCSLQALSPFPTVFIFSPLQRSFCHFLSNLKLSSADSLRFVVFGDRIKAKVELINNPAANSDPFPSGIPLPKKIRISTIFTKKCLETRLTHSLIHHFLKF